MLEWDQIQHHNINFYINVANSQTSKYIKQKYIEIKGEKWIYRVEEFNTALGFIQDASTSFPSRAWVET